MDLSSLRFPYFATLPTYTLRAPRKGNARQRRRVVRRRVRIAVLTKRLGGNVVIAG